MTLWSMARSPLMFGGDMRRLDDATFNLLSNPTLLEINSFSSNNKEFPYISSTKLPQTRRHGKLERGKSESLSLALTSCNNVEAVGWSDKAIDNDLEQVCWKDKSSKRNREPFCLYKREPLLSSDEDLTTNRQNKGKVHLFDSKMSDSCLGASPSRKLTSKETKRGSFSTCRFDTNQMWELNNNGTLVNSYSSLCAYMTNTKAEATGARAWIATGRQGEIYVAFFNLDAVEAKISMKVADLGRAIQGREFNNGSCRCREEWSGKDFGYVKDVLSTNVGSHATALFVLNC